MTGPDASDDDLEQRLRALKGEVIDGSPSNGGRQTGGGAPPPGFRRDPRRRGTGARVVSWSLGQAEGGRIGLWIGVGLLAVGVYLVLEQFVPAVRILGSLGLTLGGCLLLAWVATGRAGAWALNVGAILVGYGAFPFAAELIGLRTEGWGTLGAGLGLLALAALRLRRGSGPGWQAWIGGFFVIWGGWGALGSVIPGFPSLGDMIVPVLVLLLGITILRRGIAPGR